jgi:MFS transporter, DHA3 family, macrolide efflux protein
MARPEARLPDPRPRGLRTCGILCCGQLVSLLGTAMTRFSLLIWAYERTGEATTLALLVCFSFGPYVLISPLAGVLVDRVDRRWVMWFADLGAGLMTAALLTLYATGTLQLWHLYVAEALTGLCEAFQIPAYSAAIAGLVPKEHYARVSGMRSLASSASEVLAPFCAGVLLGWVTLRGIMLIDLATSLVALLTLLVVRIPRPAVTPEDRAMRGSPWQEVAFGFRYIFQRPGLLGLLLIFVGINLMASFTWFALLGPMVLARSGKSALSLASVKTALGFGGLLGGLVVTVWGGPRRRIHTLLAGAALSFLLSDFLLAVGARTPVWALGAFLGSFLIPFITSADQSIWQTKVAPSVQGRVFSVHGMLRTATIPLGCLLAGPLADHLFEPAMAADGRLAPVFGWLVGTGPGAGMALMFAGTAILGTGMSLSGYLVPAVRRVEEELPDHDAGSAPQEQPA